MEKGGMGRNGERGRDEEDGGGMEWCRVEGGRGSSAHSPELVVARVLVVTHVLVVTRVFVAREPWWPFWLVVVHARRGSWGMVNGARRWVVVAACGQWILAGDCSRGVGGRRGCRLCRSLSAGRPLGAAVAGCGRCWLGGAFVGGMVVFVGGQRRHGQTM